MINLCYRIQAISIIVDKEEDNYKDNMDKIMNTNIKENGLCFMFINLFNKIKNNNKDEYKKIMENIYENFYKSIK